MELKAFVYVVVIIATIVAFLVWLSIKHGRQQAYQKMEKESQEAMQRVIDNTQSIDEQVEDMTDEELDRLI